MVVSLLLAAPAMASEPTTTSTTATPIRAKTHAAVRRAHATNRAGVLARLNRSPIVRTAYTTDTDTSASALATANAAWVPPEGATPREIPPDDSASRSWQQSGIASWYGGPRWQGRKTSMGTRYDENELTAAHRTLPLGSKVLVRLAGSDRAVIVTINDRPGTRSRIIDLSRGAAAALGILDRGVAKVTLTAL
jgi:rare lipoprotein A (peptidoglycan hydrolase)